MSLNIRTLYLCFREDRSEELRKVHESKMLYLNKTQTDKVKTAFTNK